MKGGASEGITEGGDQGGMDGEGGEAGTLDNLQQ